MSSTAPAINPLTQAVALQVGPFSATIPPGSFKQTGPAFTFAGVIIGVNLQALIAPTGTLRYAFAAAAENPNLTGTTNPVPVTLTIGSDSGAKSVNGPHFPLDTRACERDPGPTRPDHAQMPGGPALAAGPVSLAIGGGSRHDPVKAGNRMHPHVGAPLRVGSRTSPGKSPLSPQAMYRRPDG